MTPIWSLNRYAYRGDRKITGRGRLIIVEPDGLLRWSILAYLKPWFDVILADSVAPAQDWLRREFVDALIVSDDIQPEALRAFYESAGALGRRPRAIVTTTGVGLPGDNASAGSTESVPQLLRRRDRDDLSIHFIEKPFELKQLAQLLGVP